MTHQCPNCQSYNTVAKSHTVVTGCGPRAESELWTCQDCGFSIRVNLPLAFAPITEFSIGEFLAECFGDPKVITTEI